MTAPKRQHQIPKSYLDRFVDRDGFVWSYDINADRVTKAAPKNTAVEGHLYSFTDNDGNRVTDIEELLARVENKAAPIIDKFLRQERLSDEERFHLSDFIAFMHVRTNWFRRQYAEVMATLGQNHMYSLAHDEAAFLASIKKYEAEKGPLTPKDRQKAKEVMKDPSGWNISITRTYTLRALRIWQPIARHIFTMEWSLLLAPPGRYFITSDNPMVKEVPAKRRGQLFHAGFGDPDIEVTLPLSPIECWLGHRDRRALPVGQATVDATKAINRIRAAYGDRYIYADRHDTGLLALARKYRGYQKGFAVSGGGPKEYARLTIRRGH